MTMFGGASSREVLLVRNSLVGPPARPDLVAGRGVLWSLWCLPSLMQPRGCLTMLLPVRIGSSESVALPDELPFVLCFGVTGGELCSLPLLPL